MRSHNISHPLVLILIVVIVASCKKAGDTKLTPANTHISINMLHTVNGNIVDYDEIKYTNEYGNFYSVIRLQYFMSDMTLIRDDGTKVFIDEEFYIDGRDNTTLVLDVDALIPLGNYVGLEFIFGLSADRNVAGRFPNPPENNMEWPPALGTGYHYMKLEGKIDSSGVIKNYQAHTGPTFGNQNFIRITLHDTYFRISESETSIGIQMDINKWWQDPATIDLNEMTMIMGNQEMQQKLHDNGVNVFSFNPTMHND